MKRFLQRLLTRLAFFCSLFVGVWMIVIKETEYFLVMIVFNNFRFFKREDKKVII